MRIRRPSEEEVGKDIHGLFSERSVGKLERTTGVSSSSWLVTALEGQPLIIMASNDRLAIHDPQGV